MSDEIEQRNATVQVCLWRSGQGLTEVPAPGPHAEQIGALADQVLEQLGTE